MKTTVDLRPFEPACLPELLRMWRASFEAGVGVVDPHPIAEQEHYFVQRVLPHHSVRIAWAGRELVGFVAASPQVVAQLYVRAGLQRRGIGTQLLEWAKAQSDGSLSLYTFARNAVARAFYERHGFVAVAHGFEPTWQLEDVQYRWSRS